ncbi:MAG: glycosyl transferase [Desulfatitalea sp.]|nr:glycosyl transferase [Desulfatitalea sp.]NNJ99299.1 glycosyl transferase [Desulfatitalea sp.]
MVDASAIFAFGLTFGLSAAFTPLVRWMALKRTWVAQPKADRWHKKPTALMGGIAIFSAMALPLAYVADFGSIIPVVFAGNGLNQVPSIVAVLLVGATFLFCLGLVDDLRSIKPQTKLIGQILAASLVVFLGFRLHWFESLTVDTMATLFWIVGITNAFNLIDNMDGLCAGVGAIAVCGLAVLYHNTAPGPFLASLILAGAMGGFLIYNFNPAKIFMGDCGSLVIGFSISVLSLCYSELPSVSLLARFSVPILILLVPILDTTLVTVIRILSGRKASMGGRDHTSHRLVLMGFSERTAVLSLYSIGIIAAWAAVFVSISDTLTSPLVIIPIALAMLLMGIYLSQLRVYPEKEFSVLRDRSFTPVLMEITYRRQILLVLLDFILIAFSYYLSYRLRFGDDLFFLYFEIFLRSLPVVIAIKMAVLFWMGIYRGMWGYFSTNDVSLYIRASLVGSMVTVVAVTFIYRFEDFSKGVFLIDWLLSTCLFLGVRGSFRFFLETQKRKTLTGDKVVIYGAGRAGELLLREILNNERLKVKPIGFIDDDVFKTGKRIQGFPIMGTFETIEQIHERHGLDGIVVSFNDVESNSRLAHDAVKGFCQKRGLSLKCFKIDLKRVELGN